MNNIEQLAKWKAEQKANGINNHDWHLAKLINILKHEIRTGIRLCLTCEGHAEVGSPCGACGVGMKEI